MKLPSFQINIVSVYQFLKKLRHEKFQMDFLFRGDTHIDITVPESCTDTRRSDPGTRTILKDRELVSEQPPDTGRRIPIWPNTYVQKNVDKAIRSQGSNSDETVR